MAAWLIGRNGFTSAAAARDRGGLSTADQVRILLDGKPNGRKLVGLEEGEEIPPSAVETAGNALAWAQAIPPTVADDYLNNLRLLAREEAVFGKHSTLLASLVPAYQRAHGEAQKRRAEAAAAGRPPAHVGKVGEPWEGVVEVLWTTQIDSDYGTSTLVVARADGADIVSWFSRGMDPPAAGNWAAVRGTVKEHRYRVDKRTGEQRPETSLTRVKATYWPLFRGRDPWRYTRAEWARVPEVVATAELKAAREMETLDPHDRDARDRWRQSAGLPPSPTRDTWNDREWLAHVNEVYAPVKAAEEAAHAKMREAGINGEHQLPSIPDHAAAVKGAYEAGLPVPTEVLVDYADVIAFVDAERAAAAAAAARKKSRAKPSPAEQARESAAGPAVRAVEAAFAAVATRIGKGESIGDLAVGLTSATGQEVRDGDLPACPAASHVKKDEVSYRSWGARVIFTPAGASLVYGRINAYGGVTWSAPGPGFVPYDRPDFVDACVAFLASGTQTIAPEERGEPSKFARAQVDDFVRKARAGRERSGLEYDGWRGREWEEQRARSRRELLELLSLQPDAYLAAVEADAPELAAGSEDKVYAVSAIRQLVAGARLEKDRRRSSDLAARLAARLHAEARDWPELAAEVGAPSPQGLRRAAEVCEAVEAFLLRHRSAVGAVAAVPGPPAAAVACLPEAVEWVADIAAPMRPATRDHFSLWLNDSRYLNVAKDYMPDPTKVFDRAAKAYEKAAAAKSKKGTA